MNRRMMGLALMAVEAAVLAIPARADTQKLMADVAGQAPAMVTLKCTFQNEMGPNPVTAQAVCIDASGVFITSVFDARTQPEMLKDFTLTLPGVEGKTVKADLKIPAQEAIDMMKAVIAQKPKQAASSHAGATDSR